jgi:hypothetical protein
MRAPGPAHTSKMSRMEVLVIVQEVSSPELQAFKVPGMAAPTGPVALD